MQVVGGTVKGRKLIPPSDRSSRPTSSLVKSAIFNILRPEQVVGVRVLDLFAGTGSLGIEALSRGGNWVDLIEWEINCCNIMRRNLNHMGFSDKSKIYCMPVGQALQTLEEAYQLILMDPPYKLKTLDPVLECLSESSLVETGTVVVVGHSKRQDLKSDYGDMIAVRNRQYGDSWVHFFVKGRTTW